MLEVQKYLRDGGTIGGLEKEFGITHHIHPLLPLVGLKYHQINSSKYKTHQIVRECRGVVLELDTWNLIGKGFNRFFNYGESDDPFIWYNFTAEEKVDGTNVIVLNYHNQWLTKTCGGWTGSCGLSSTKTFDQLFRENFDKFHYLKKDYTYVFELCTIENKVVRTYEKPSVYLLGMFDISKDGRELSKELVDSYAFWSAIKRPQTFFFNSPKNTLNWLEENSKIDPTFEGFVLRDQNNNRLKMKSPTYLLWHHAGSNSINRRQIIEIVLKNEQDEFLSVFPEYTLTLNEVSDRLNNIIETATQLFESHSHIEDQKDFATAVKDFRGKALLFEKRKAPIDFRKYLLEKIGYAEKLLL